MTSNDEFLLNLSERNIFHISSKAIEAIKNGEKSLIRLKDFLQVRGSENDSDYSRREYRVKTLDEVISSESLNKQSWEKPSEDFWREIVNEVNLIKMNIREISEAARESLAKNSGDILVKIADPVAGIVTFAKSEVKSKHQPRYVLCTKDESKSRAGFAIELTEEEILLLKGFKNQT